MSGPRANLRGARMISGMRRAVGVGLLALPFLPLPRIFGEIAGASALATPLEWVLGLAIFGTSAWLLAMALWSSTDAIASRAAAAARAVPARPLAWVAMLALATLLALTSAVAFRHHPLLVDSVAQLFQAEIFASGSVAAPAPRLDAFFLTQHMLVDGGRWYSQYPPGHSALLALGVLLGPVWLVPVLLSLGTAIVLFAFVRRVYDAATAKLSLVLLVLCPFFWFMGASFMNHVSALFFVTIFLYAFAAWDQEQRAGWLLAAGAALGAGYLSRPLECLAIGVPFGIVALGRAWRRRLWGGILCAVLGFGVVSSGYLLYNALTTGNAFQPGYVKLWGDTVGLGFSGTPWGDVHSPWTGLRNELTDLSLLGVFLFEWPVPALLPVGLLFAAGWGRRDWDGLLLAGFLAIPAVYFFYWHRDAFLGPRFLYSGIAFVIPLTARALLEAWSRLRGRSFQLGGLFRPADGAVLAGLLLVLCSGYSIFYAVPQRFRIYASGMSSMKVDVVAQAREAGLTEGLVFVTESWGSRLLAEARGMGVSASLAERAYRTTDHCQLDLTLRRARREGRTRAEVIRAVERLMTKAPAPEKLNLTGDPTLRLGPGLLPEPCADELRYDRQGFDLFTPHLPENRPGLDGPFVVARDLRTRNAELQALYPGKPAYLYRNGSFAPLR